MVKLRPIKEMENIGVGDNMPEHLLVFEHNGKTAYFDITKEGKCIFNGDIDPKSAANMFFEEIKEQIQAGINIKLKEYDSK